MNKPINEYGFHDFRMEIKKAIPSGKSENLHFSQSASAYYADYRPDHPNKTAGDFTICLLFGATVPRLSIYQDTACVPSIKQYKDFADLSADLAEIE